jgi:hypothetical protein
MERRYRCGAKGDGKRGEIPFDGITLVIKPITIWLSIRNI